MIKDKKPYKILIVEDNAGDLLFISEFLHEQIANPIIEHALNYKQAVKSLIEDECAYDIILLDLSLPDKSGQELITEMLDEAKNCPIVVLTGYVDIEFSITTISQGIIDYIIKDDLNSTILYKSIIYAIERKKTVAALQKSEKQFADLFNLSPQPMWVYEPETLKFIQVNEAAVMQYGYSEEEFLAMTILDIRPLTDAYKVLNNIPKNNEDIVTKGKFLHLKKNKEIIQVEIYSTPITINNITYRSVIAIDVTERVQYEHKITKAIIKTQDDERYEIGSELHDNVCQILAASQMTLGMLKESLTENKIPIYNLCKENISLALDEIRNLSHQLAPAFFDDTTLEEAITRLLKTFNINEKYEIGLEIDDAISTTPFGRDVQLTLYRILQEQLNNIFKHAHAKNILVAIKIIDQILTMQIKDDGAGFDNEHLKGGIGFANMKRRTELFSGTFRLQSAPNKGCILQVEIPLTGLI